jgi:hypothetical protein
VRNARGVVRVRATAEVTVMCAPIAKVTTETDPGSSSVNTWGRGEVPETDPGTVAEALGVPAEGKRVPEPHKLDRDDALGGGRWRAHGEDEQRLQGK